jgi:histidine triad (HIT) family protein
MSDYDPQNPFARILRGELPSIRVYEDEFTVALMDIMPQADGHVLILTKEPAAELFELSADGAAACMRTTHAIARAVKAALAPAGVLIAQFNGRAAGQTVPHVHFHVIPREAGEALKPHASEPADTGRLQEIAARIKAALAKDGHKIAQ